MALPMGQPPCRPGNAVQQRKQLRRYFHGMVNQSCVKIYIRQDLASYAILRHSYKYWSDRTIFSSSIARLTKGFFYMTLKTCLSSCFTISARGSFSLKIRWPKPYSNLLLCLTSIMNLGIFSLEPIFCSICIIADAAPPYFPPDRAPAPAATAVYKSVPDEATCLTMAVEQLLSS